MASASPWEEMEESFFTCSICLGNLKDPKQLPCLHRFCRGCLKPVVEKNKKTFACPLCKYDCTIPTNGVDGFRSDFHSKNIIEFIQLQKTVKDKEIRECVGCSKETTVTSHCFKCTGFLCDACFQLHQTNGMLKDHRESVLTLDDIKADKLTFEKLTSLRSGPVCSEHPNKLAEICCGSCDNLPICIVCGHYEKHKGHELHGVKNLAAEERMKAEKIQGSLQVNKEKAYRMPKEIEDATKALNANIAEKKEKLLKQYNQKAEVIKLKQRESTNALRKHDEQLDTAQKNKLAELERERDEKIQAIREDYDKLITDVKTKNKKERDKKKAPEEKYMNVLSEAFGSLDKEFKDLKDSVNNQGKQNAEKLKALSQNSIQQIIRLDTYLSTVKSVLSSCDDWTDVRCLPEINAIGEPLSKDVEKGYPDITALSDVAIHDFKTDIPEKNMDDQDKKPYQASADQDKLRYEREMAHYKPSKSEKKKGKKRKKKDPDAPKRNLSAFFLYSNDQRAAVRAQHPNWNVGMVAKKLSEQWKVIDPARKAKYERAAVKDKERYMKAMEAYQARKAQKKKESSSSSSSSSSFSSSSSSDSDSS